MISETCRIEDVIMLLNVALEMDRDAISQLMFQRVPCNTALADHPTIQVGVGLVEGEPKNYDIGPLGILNGLFGTDDRGYGPITMEFDEDTHFITKFSRTAVVKPA